MSFIKLDSVGKIYVSGELTVPAIKDISLEINEASFVSFVGPSGSGKSTLLNLLGCLDQPSKGSVSINGTLVNKLNQLERANFRGKNIGFIFQNFNLLPVLTVFENVEYPLFMVQDIPKEERKKRVLNLLEKVGMLDQKNKYPNQLSGGQKQRVAVARALVTSPKVVLADEPTANLDSVTAFQVIKVLHHMRDAFGTTFVFATHDPKIVKEAEVIYTLEDGQIKNHEIMAKESK
ncbi:MAG: ABC transporter [Bdellovibrionales bacterium RIFOXYB1_FULL_37_110]|nr:MAG: ABC transporter [Bdellovibrionales bacterium RIFOXYC1_FULL_37_79]OFZ57323.1 MAG: ABC transporter [Bdellovibrionales bacterium RIFOXYB1_FULL_37_110]OFZ62219.1 MAG: ABC transporter [Bdellovibrionales bacterium RIFOXYD1_FULL_36_51]